MSERWDLGFAPSAHLVQPHRLLESLGHQLADVAEEKTLARRELTDDIGHENLAGLGVVADAGGKVDRPRRWARRRSGRCVDPKRCTTTPRWLANAQSRADQAGGKEAMIRSPVC